MYTDEELMHFIINGEEFAFNELYKRYAKKLLGYFTRMLNYDKNMAEDALQDVFLKIAEAPTKFDNSRSFRTWVFTIASNQCKNFYRHQTVINQKRDEIKIQRGLQIKIADGSSVIFYDQKLYRQDGVFEAVCHRGIFPYPLRYRCRSTTGSLFEYAR